MTRNVIRFALWMAVIAVGATLLVVVAYFVTGSLEDFPTEEQVSNVRVVTAVLAAILIAIEIGLWTLLRRTAARRSPGELAAREPRRLPPD